MVGEFTFLRPVTVLDLRELEGSSVPAGMSWLQNDFEEKYAYAKFMRGLHDLIRRPVLPDAASLDYLPTQIIAEYLASLAAPGIEGVLFTSSQRARSPSDDNKGRASNHGLNVVLFASASVVEGQDQTPMRRVNNVRSFLVSDDEDDDGWGVSNEWVSYEPVTAPPLDPSEEDDPWSIEEPGIVDIDSTAPPTLRIMHDNLTIVHVRGVVYQVVERNIDFSDATGKSTDF